MTQAEKKYCAALLASLAVLVGALAFDVWFLPVRVLTDFNGQPALSPLYAFWMPVISLRILRPVLAVAVYFLWIGLTTRQWMQKSAAAWWVVLGHVAWLAMFAICVAAIRLPLTELGGAMNVYLGEDFWYDVPKVESPGSFLSDFVRLQAHRRLSLHGMAHPPGHTLFLWAVTEVFGRSTNAAALSMLAVGCTSLIPTYLLARRLFGDRIAGRVLVLVPVVPSITMFAVTSTDFLFLAFASWSLWAAIEALLGRNPAAAIAAGVIGGIAAMFSFAEGFIGIIVSLCALAGWIERSGTAIPRQLACMAGGLVSCYLAVRWALGYDWIESFFLTHQFHRYVISSEIGRLTAGMWLYTSFGNLLAFAWYLGVPVVAGAALSLWTTFRAGLWTGGQQQHFTRAVALTLALMVFGGLFLLEVERIWLYMVGPLTAVACTALPEFESPIQERRWMILLAGIMGLQSIAYESLLFTIW